VGVKQGSEVDTMKVHVGEGDKMQSATGVVLQGMAGG